MRQFHVLLELEFLDEFRDGIETLVESVENRHESPKYKEYYIELFSVKLIPLFRGTFLPLPL